jgi:acyl dehydratase
MGKHFEDFNAGDVFVTRGRSMTEADILQYAALSWDCNPEHTDMEFAKQSPFQERIAQQQLGVLIAHGLVASSRLLEGTQVSTLRLGWNLLNPMRIGDTLHVKQTVTEKRDVPLEEGGIITFQIETINQRDELVNRCQRTMLMARRSPAGTAAPPRPYLFMALSELEERIGEPLLTNRVGAPPTASRDKRTAPPARSHDAEPDKSEPKKTEENQPRGKYFEEVELGEELVTQARTVTEADVFHYTSLSWDTDPLHTDAEYGRATPYGGIIAPLLLPPIFANGLGAVLGYLAGTNRGALGDWWEFVRPVRIGDTLHFRQVITATQEAQDPETGIVTYGMEMINQRREVISQGQRSALVARRPQSQEESKPWKFVFGTAQDLAKE